MRQGAKRVAPKKAATKALDPYKRELAERIDQAFRQYNARRDRDHQMKQEDLGAVVAKKVGLAAPYTQGAVSGWMNPKKPATPNNPTLKAIADVLGVDAMWLILGATEE
jgi:hypothetical protein